MMAFCAIWFDLIHDGCLQCCKCMYNISYNMTWYHQHRPCNLTKIDMYLSNDIRWCSMTWNDMTWIWYDTSFFFCLTFFFGRQHYQTLRSIHLLLTVTWHISWVFPFHATQAMGCHLHASIPSPPTPRRIAKIVNSEKQRAQVKAG